MIFSSEGTRLVNYIKAVKETHKLLGTKYFYRDKSEDNNKIFRRSIYAIKDIQKGDKFTNENIKVVRPGNGIHPIFFENLLKKKSPSFISSNNPLTYELLKKLKLSTKYRNVI